MGRGDAPARLRWAGKTAPKAQPPQPTLGSRNGVKPREQREQWGGDGGTALTPKALLPQPLLLAGPQGWGQHGSACTGLPSSVSFIRRLMRLTRLMRPILSLSKPRLPRCSITSAPRRCPFPFPDATGRLSRHRFGCSQVGASCRVPRGCHRSGTRRARGKGWWGAQGAGSLGSISCGKSPISPGCATNSLRHPVEAGWDIRHVWGDGDVGITRPSSASHRAEFQVGSAPPPMFRCHPLGFRHDQVNDEGKGKYYIIVTVIIIIHYFKHVK